MHRNTQDIAIFRIAEINFKFFRYISSFSIIQFSTMKPCWHGLKIFEKYPIGSWRKKALCGETFTKLDILGNFFHFEKITEVLSACNNLSALQIFHARSFLQIWNSVQKLYIAQ